MYDTSLYQNVTQWLEESHKPLLFSHTRPDGDALGALAGMTLALRELGREPYTCLFDPIPPRYDFFANYCDWLVWDDVREIVSHECDAVVIVDTCALAQLEPATVFLQQAPRTLVIDHHATHDPIGMRDEDHRLFDDSASAASLIVAEWIESTGVKLTETMANVLYVGLATDTGWFRFSNTDARTLRMAATLIDAGARPAGLHNLIQQREPVEKLRLVAHLLTHLELHADGRLAVMYLREKDFEATGATRAMTEDLVNEAARLNSTEATLLFTEDSDDVVRVNLRSKEELDVAELARRFGGGGHARAAGLRLRGPWDQVVPRMIADTIEAL